MNSLKKIFVSGLIALTFLTMVNPSPSYAFEPDQDKGPLETYLDCAQKCIDKYAPWSLRRIACAADCFGQLIGDAINTIAPDF